MAIAYLYYDASETVFAVGVVSFVAGLLALTTVMVGNADFRLHRRSNLGMTPEASEKLHQLLDPLLPILSAEFQAFNCVLKLNSRGTYLRFVLEEL